MFAIYTEFVNVYGESWFSYVIAPTRELADKYTDENAMLYDKYGEIADEGRARYESGGEFDDEDRAIEFLFAESTPCDETDARIALNDEWVRRRFERQIDFIF